MVGMVIRRLVVVVVVSGTVSATVVLVVVVAGGAVVVVVVSGGATALGTGLPSSGGASASGLFNTCTRVPAGTSLKKVGAAYIGIRMQPCDAGYAGTEGDPWMAIPPLKYMGHHSSPSGATSR